MESNETSPTPEPSGRPFGTRISLRLFIIAVMAFGMGMFVWYRTEGDAILAVVVAAMTAAVVEIRVSDPRLE